MRELKLILFLVLTFAEYSIAQQVKFEKVYGGAGYDYGYSVTQTYDEGYVVAGATTSFGNGGTDAYILKVDSLGNLKWHRTFGGINVEQAYCIKETVDTGLIIAGYTNSFGLGGYDMYVIRTDRNGDTLWTKTYGGTNWDFAYSIEPTVDGGYVLCGGTYSFGNGNEDMYLVKLNSSGDTVWTRTYGGSNEEEAKSVKQTSDGGYILTGHSKSVGDPDGDIFTVKTNSVGDTLWTNKYGGAEEDGAFDILESYTGEFIIGGRTKSIGSGNFDGVVVRLSSSGGFVNNDAYGGTDDDGLYSIELAANGRFAAAGYTYTYGFGLGTSDYVLYVQNPFNGFHSGNFGGNKMEKAYCINATKDNGYIMCGTSSSYTNLDHIYLIKLDSNGVSSALVNTVVTSVNSIKESDKSLKLYPNPATNEFYIELETLPHNQYTIRITDILGRERYQLKLNKLSSQPILINTYEFPSGIYVIHVEGENVNTNQRLIIQH